jgi:hypothetical protein
MYCLCLILLIHCKVWTRARGLLESYKIQLPALILVTYFVRSLENPGENLLLLFVWKTQKIHNIWYYLRVLRNYFFIVRKVRSFSCANTDVNIIIMQILMDVWSTKLCTVLHCPWLTLILLMWRIGWAPNNASKWQMELNSAFNP